MGELELWHRVQAFLFHEARLLDERRFGEWLELYAPDAEYWVNHFLSNVTIEDAGGSELVARAYLLYCEYRREEQRWFAGRATWRLRAEGKRYRIAAKRVDLLNADQDS